MQEIIEFLRTDTFLMILAVVGVILIIGFFVLIIKLSNIQKKYKTFLKKLGNGKDIYEDLENYMYRVERVEKQNAEILTGMKTLEEDLTKCIQKVGMVRYNAFKDTGSDLSFALALLDDKNNGVVLNGIYSREMSNIYAKPVQNGVSPYTVSEEEKQAIEKAVNSSKIIKLVTVQTKKIKNSYPQNITEFVILKK